MLIGSYSSHISNHFYSLFTSNHIYSLRQRVCSISKDTCYIPRIFINAMYCHYYRRMPSYGGYCPCYFVAYHPTDDSKPIHIQIYKYDLAIHRHWFYQLYRRIIIVILVECSFWSHNYIFFNPYLCWMQN